MKLIALLLLTLMTINWQSGAADSPQVKGGDPASDHGFIPVQGIDMKSKIDSAIKLAQSNPNANRFWVGYPVAVRPGIAIDTEIVNKEGKKVVLKGTNVSFDPPFDTRNLGIFMLYDWGGDTVKRMEIYNLDRPRKFDGYPVYWLGQVENEESFNLLRKLIDTKLSSNLPEVATMAIGLYNDQRVGSLLEEIYRQSTSEKVRGTAIFWLGQGNGDPSFFSEIALDEKESTEIRKQAVFAIGISKHKTAITTLRELYNKVSNHHVKMHIIFAASLNGGKTEATEFLNEIAATDTDSEARKLAAFWLGQKSDEYSSNRFSLKPRPQ